MRCLRQHLLVDAQGGDELVLLDQCRRLGELFLDLLAVAERDAAGRRLAGQPRRRQVHDEQDDPGDDRQGTDDRQPRAPVAALAAARRPRRRRAGRVRAAATGSSETARPTAVTVTNGRRRGQSATPRRRRAAARRGDGARRSRRRSGRRPRALGRRRRANAGGSRAGPPGASGRSAATPGSVGAVGHRPSWSQSVEALRLRDRRQKSTANAPRATAPATAGRIHTSDVSPLVGGRSRIVVPYSADQRRPRSAGRSPPATIAGDLVAHGDRRPTRRLGHRQVLTTRAADLRLEGGGPLGVRRVAARPDAAADRQGHARTTSKATSPSHGGSPDRFDAPARAGPSPAVPDRRPAGIGRRAARRRGRRLRHRSPRDRAGPRPAWRRAGPRGRADERVGDDAAVRVDQERRGRGVDPVGVGDRPAGVGNGRPLRAATARRTSAAPATVSLKTTLTMAAPGRPRVRCWLANVPPGAAPRPGTGGTSWRRS